MSIEARFQGDHQGFRLNAELSLPQTGVSVIFGPSGAGKSTLLRAMAGLTQYPGGYLKVGPDIWQDESRFLPTHARPIGYVFQEPSLFPHLSVLGNLEYGFRRAVAVDRHLQIDQAAELMGLTSLLSRRSTSLSGGERQRAAIARALLTSPELLLMDEPLAALDQQAKNEILPFIQQLQQNLDIPILYVTHARDEVARLADYLVLVDAGRVQAAGKAAEMLTRVDLSLADGDQAESVLEATVAGFDDHYHLAYLDFAGGRFSIRGDNLSSGQTLRLQIKARDVSLTTKQQENTSILNIFPAKVHAIADQGPAQVMVRLSLGGVFILSRITKKSADHLNLQAGAEVYAQVKSVALLT